jgi:T5SS/PEP-CTERM-associated repeat protein
MSSRAEIVRLVALAGLVVPSLSYATVRSWANAAGGAAATGANWSPSGVPVAGDVLNYGMGGAYSVSFNSTVGTVAQQNFNAGTVVLSASSPSTATSQFVVGLSGASTVSISSGQFGSNGTIAIAGGSGSFTSTATVTGPTSSLMGTSTSALLRVGNGSTGTLNVLDGGLVQTAGGVSIGAFGSSQGTVLISGVNGTHSSLVTTDPVAGDITVGTAGNGSLTVTSGGHLTCADDLLVAPNAGFTGTVNIGGAGAGNVVSIDGDLAIANNSTAAAAGTGTVDIGAAAVSSSATRVGDPDGGTGTLHMSGFGSLTTGSLTIDPVHGVLQHDNGQLRVIGGPCVLGTPGVTLDGANAGDLARLNIESGATLTPSDLVVVGGIHSGRLTILGAPAAVTPAAGVSVILGNALGGDGTLQVRVGGRLAQSGAALLIVGQNGDGTLTLETGGVVQTHTCDIGAQNSGSGAATVDGAGTTLDMAGDLWVGGSSSGPHGPGSLSITNGGLVSADGVATVWNTGSLGIDHATMTVGGDLKLMGSSATMTAGTINAGRLFVANGASLTASGLVNGRVDVGTASCTITASGPLTMGDPTDALGVASIGTLAVGSQSVTLLDSGFAQAGGVVTIAGGSLNANNGVVLFPTNTLTGNGTVNCAISNGGTITATGAGLTFNGVVNGIGSGLGGTTLTFGSGGGFTGSGSMTATINAQNGSVITATGALHMGNSAAGSSVTLGGTLLTGSNSVNLVVPSGARPLITGTVNIEPGGSLNVQSPGVQVKRIGAPIAAIRGSGFVTNPLYNNGLVSPGLLSGDRTQTLRPEFLYDQHGIAPASPGTLEIDIEGTNPGDFDVVAVFNGNAVLDGTLIVNRLNGFFPPVGQEFTILTANSVTGTFPVVIAEGFVVIYEPTDVKLRFIGICDSADFDCDEDIGTDADIEAFFACIAGNCPAAPCNNDADFNNDGDLGTDADIEAFFRVLAGGSCY